MPWGPRLSPRGASTGPWRASRGPARACSRLFRLPQDRRAFAEALFNGAPVRSVLAEPTCEDAHDRSEAVEVLGKTHARRREFAPSLEPLSQVLRLRVEVTGRLGGDRCPGDAGRFGVNGRFCA